MMILGVFSTNREGGGVERGVLFGRVATAWLIALCCVSIPAAHAADKMYWTDKDEEAIRRANVDGSDVEDLVTSGLGEPLALALDMANGKMYWSDKYTDTIGRANVDGSNVEDLVTSGLKEVYGLALDVAGGKMYWTDKSEKVIRRANLDGTNIEDLITSGLEEGGFKLQVQHSVRRRLRWAFGTAVFFWACCSGRRQCFQHAVW